MKAKLNTVIFSALLLAALPAKAQFADNRDFRYDDAGIVINNYYDDYDYYYSSRINRFHRSYAAFDYYSPVFTETYWYNYQPYSWGTSIYGRSALGFGFAINFPVYYYGLGTDYWYDYNYGWYDPYYGSSWYWGYDPFYYSMYSPVYININIGPRWGSNHWYRHGFWHNDYQPVFHTTNNYYYDSSPVRNSYRPMPERRPDGYSRTAGTRKETIPYSGRVNQTAGNSAENANNANDANNANNGNNRNSRPEGNRGNFDRNDRNVNNSGNNNNSRPDGNNGNFGNKNGNERLPAPARTQTGPAAGPRSNQGSGRTYNAPSESSSSDRNKATVSQERNSSGRSATRSSGQSSRSGSSSQSKSTSKSSSDSKTGDSKRTGARK
jgi:hypothetical protein